MALQSSSSSSMDSSSATMYPVRSDQPDCAYYLRCGYCKYGEHCRFNHPTVHEKLHSCFPLQDIREHPEREGRPECQFYMRTGTCKFGIHCKYRHPQRDGLGNWQVKLNFLGLPVRRGGKTCAFYLRTGSCKYGMACKFHHPELVNSPGMLPMSDIYSSDMVSPVTYQAGPLSWLVEGGATYIPVFSPFVPFFVPPQTVSTPIWNSYEGLANHVSPLHAQEVAEGGLATVAVPQVLASSAQSLEFFLPERPGQPDCQHFIKTGHCKFGPNCRYHHAKNMTPSYAPPSLSIMGLPLRPGEPLCSFYLRKGICKFGPTCKFDHPIHSSAVYAVQVPLMSTPSRGGCQGAPSLSILKEIKGQEEPSKGTDDTTAPLAKAEGNCECLASHKDPSQIAKSEKLSTLVITDSVCRCGGGFPITK